MNVMLQIPPFSPEFRAQLLARYKKEARPRFAARLHCLLLKDEGYTQREIAAILHVSDNTITSWLRLFLEGGLERLCRFDIRGASPALSPEQLAALEAEMARRPYSWAKEVAAWVREQFGVSYSERGMQALLKRRGYSRQKVRLVPGKADPAKQALFFAGV